MTLPVRRTLSDELANFARYSESVASDAAGPSRLTWRERAEWASRLAYEAGEIDAEVERLQRELEARDGVLIDVEKGIGSLLWALNNAHNAHTAMWKQIANAAELDARAALVRIRGALEQEREA